MVNRRIGRTTKRSDSSQEQSLSCRRREKGKREDTRCRGEEAKKRSQDGDGSMTWMAKRNVVEQRWEGRETKTRVEAGSIGRIGVRAGTVAEISMTEGQCKLESSRVPSCTMHT
jgi:hypothetical protein